VPEFVQAEAHHARREAHLPGDLIGGVRTLSSDSQALDPDGMVELLAQIEGRP
jgi:hypothetical protein